MASDPRNIALDILTDWDASRRTLDQTLALHTQVVSALPPKDKNLCNALVFGVLRSRIFLDHLITGFSNIPLKKIEPAVRYILRLALFQMTRMDRIPDFAAIDTAVNMAKKKAGKKASGFVNAVLRNAAKNWQTRDLPDKDKFPLDHLSISYSIPLWLTKRWASRFGAEKTEHIFRRINSIPDITLRVNTLKTDRDSLESLIKQHAKTTGKTELACQGLHITGPDTSIEEMDAFIKGLFQVQDEAAQIVTEILAPEPGERILDACAGLGGKTGHIAQMMADNGALTALDVSENKVTAMKKEAERLGIHILETRSLDLLKTSVKDFTGYFDRVLVDAPCSGLGVLKRNPDTKFKRTINDIRKMAATQKKILNAAAGLVRPGGILVFAVCSCEQEENEAVIEHFLNKRKDFSIDKDAQFDKYSTLMTRDGFLRTYPAAAGMDGFFAARLKRKARQQ